VGFRIKRQLIDMNEGVKPLVVLLGEEATGPDFFDG
jgi:hypothetical protein